MVAFLRTKQRIDMVILWHVSQFDTSVYQRRQDILNSRYKYDEVGFNYYSFMGVIVKWKIIYWHR
jgi:hypothetical protein